MISRMAPPAPREDLHEMGILTIAVPDAELEQHLVSTLEDRWACCALEQPGLPMVLVFLSPHNESDFSHLVSRVQAWVTENALGKITFELRGRGHIHGQAAASAN